MSHPDPLFDPDNAYEDDMNYDDHDDFFRDDLDELRGREIDNDDRTNDYWAGDDDLENDFDDSYDDSMDGDAESALASAGWGTDEDYGYYGDVDYSEDFHSDDGYGYYED